MKRETLRHRVPGALCAGLALILLMAPSRPAAAQGIGLMELMKMMDWGTGSLILFDKLEYAATGEGRPLIADVTGWYGGAYSRLWLLAEGEQLTSASEGEAELRLSYGRLVTPYWDALAGVRVDQRWGEEGATRAHLAIGVIGLAPLRFEASPTLFLSQDGDLSARLEAEYQILVTQRLVAEPEIELNAALQEVPEWGVGSGLNDVELGFRLRYEFRREFAPYIGYAWTRSLGETAEFARMAGDRTSGSTFVAGVRFWR